MISSLLSTAIAALAVVQLVECGSFARDGKTPGIVRLAVVSKVCFLFTDLSHSQDCRASLQLLEELIQISLAAVATTDRDNI